jgi:hypothetical protein
MTKRPEHDRKIVLEDLLARRVELVCMLNEVEERIAALRVAEKMLSLQNARNAARMGQANLERLRG